ASHPARSIAASSTRQFITVASIPIVSPIGRGTPRSDTPTPRKMLPPPTTTPSSTPSLAHAARSLARRWTIAWSIPKPFAADSASPDNLTMTRRKTEPLMLAIRIIYNAHAEIADRCPILKTTKVRSSLTGGGRHLGYEISFLLLDTLTECIAYEAGNL